MRKDIILNADRSFKVTNGDFTVGESDQQHIELILSTNPNDWKATPITGVAMIKNIGGNLTGFAKRNVQVQLEADGYVLQKINETENGIDVTAKVI